MKKTINHKEIIDTEHLYWGHHKLNGIVSEEQRQEFCDLELFDWLSSIYWGEGIALNYALKMSEVSPNKEKWLEVYRDEHRHLTLIGNWFVQRGLTPSPRNKIVDFLYNTVDQIDVKMSEEALIKRIYTAQVLHEENLHSWLKVRMKFIKDRSLKAILYQIFVDESEHLSKARSEIAEMNQKPKKLYEVLEANKRIIFPLGVVKDKLTVEQLTKVKEFENEIVMESLELARGCTNLYRPIKVLHQFLKIPGYNCVACSPKRHDGLNLEPRLNSELNLVEDDYVFPRRCEGFNSVVHGGYIGMILDEIMGYAVILQRGKLPLTRDMTIKFHRPIFVGNNYKITAVVDKEEGQNFFCKGYIKDQDGAVVAESDGNMFVPTEARAPKILGDLAKHEVVQGMFL
ncbi:MAG: hotdog domain-containing protein [Bacteriovoracia bacterium]